MNKYIVLLVIIMLALSTVFVAAIGDPRVDSNGDKICVQSRSCAINYMNNLDRD